jgi:hypothetical protein
VPVVYLLQTGEWCGKLTQEFKNSTARFKFFYFIYVIFGFALFAYMMRDFPIERFKDVLLFIALIIVADTAQITLPRGGASIYASSPIDLAAIMLLGGPATVFIEAVATLLSEVFIQRRSPIRIAFNVPLLIVTVGLSGVVYQSFGAQWTSLESPRFLLPLFVCGMVYYAVNTFSISAIIGLSDGKNLFRIWKQNYMWNFTHILAFLPVAAIIALVYLKSGMWTIALFVIPLFLARYTFQLYIEMKEAHINTVAALTSALSCTTSVRSQSKRISCTRWASSPTTRGARYQHTRQLGRTSSRTSSSSKRRRSWFAIITSSPTGAGIPRG